MYFRKQKLIDLKLLEYYNTINSQGNIEKNEYKWYFYYYIKRQSMRMTYIHSRKLSFR